MSESIEHQHIKRILSDDLRVKYCPTLPEVSAMRIFAMAYQFGRVFGEAEVEYAYRCLWDLVDQILKDMCDESG